LTYGLAAVFNVGNGRYYGAELGSADKELSGGQIGAQFNILDCVGY
jgi:hypothetical protein